MRKNVICILALFFTLTLFGETKFESVLNNLAKDLSVYLNNQNGIKKINIININDSKTKKTYSKAINTFSSYLATYLKKEITIVESYDDADAVISGDVSEEKIIVVSLKLESKTAEVLWQKIKREGEKYYPASIFLSLLFPGIGDFYLGLPIQGGIFLASGVLLVGGFVGTFSASQYYLAKSKAASSITHRDFYYKYYTNLVIPSYILAGCYGVLLIVGIIEAAVSTYLVNNNKVKSLVFNNIKRFDIVVSEKTVAFSYKINF